MNYSSCQNNFDCLIVFQLLNLSLKKEEDSVLLYKKHLKTPHIAILIQYRRHHQNNMKGIEMLVCLLLAVIATASTNIIAGTKG